ncbi:MAG: hypothetical protein CMJ48_08355 [Planctomycetaceae bacterium]|nr:hypothetical protein [Planctomycetaceae bacterium]
MFNGLLGLDWCSVTSEGLRSLESLPSVTHLDLAHTNIDSSLARTISKMPNLRRLKLTGTRIGDEFFKHWGEHSKLMQLSVDSTRITDRAVKSLADNPPPNLSILDLNPADGITKNAANDVIRIKTLTFLAAPKSFDTETRTRIQKAIPGITIVGLY